MEKATHEDLVGILEQRFGRTLSWKIVMEAFHSLSKEDFLDQGWTDLALDRLTKVSD